jgi:predicted peptidase
MKTTLVLAACFLAAALAASAAESQTVASFEKTITKKVGYQYLLALPTGYDVAKEKSWPLMLFLHGSGERGADVWRVAVHGPPKLLRESPRSSAGQALAENFIVVSPQCPANTWWDDDAIGALLDEIGAKHRVDAKRVYLTGLSMGGFGTWSYAMKNPGRFAAIVPICGGGEPSLVRRMARLRKNELTTLGVWVFHGAKDPTVLLSESEQMVDALKKAAVTEVKFTIYPEAKHDSWTETYANPELYAWLLRHTR